MLPQEPEGAVVAEVKAVTASAEQTSAMEWKRSCYQNEKSFGECASVAAKDIRFDAVISKGH